MKFNIVSIAGGLGNQMFQYAYFLSLKYKKEKDITDIYIAPYSWHNGYELDNVFNIKPRFFKNISIRIAKKLLSFWVEKNIDIKWGTFNVFEPQTNNPIIYHSGYWQSEKYFIDIEKKIQCVFKFNVELLNKKTRELEELINNRNTISLHVRRGDYISDAGANQVLGGICNINYYQSAIQKIESRVANNPLYIIFTDDLEWVKDNIKLSHSIIVDWNRGKDCWQDMHLMSKCNHNIIANSTFSWWGAWLNTNNEKIVIAPQKWFNAHTASNIVPTNRLRV